MKSRVKRSSRRDSIHPIQSRPHTTLVNLNDEEDQEPLPLEYNFTTKKAELNGTTYTFSFPNMWRTSKNKNIIGIRKINYFKGPCNFDFDICIVWKLRTDTYTFYNQPNEIDFDSTASIDDITTGLNEKLKGVYTNIKNYYGTDLGNNYSFDYFNEHFYTASNTETPAYEHKIYINSFRLNEKTKDFFNLHNKPLEHITAYIDFDRYDLELYDITELNEVMYEREANFQVCCSFVPQSDIQYVGLVNETFIPIKYYALTNENRYFQMKLLTFDGKEKAIPPLENDFIIIEAQLL